MKIGSVLYIGRNKNNLRIVEKDSLSSEFANNDIGYNAFIGKVRCKPTFDDSFSTEMNIEFSQFMKDDLLSFINSKQTIALSSGANLELLENNYVANVEDSKMMVNDVSFMFEGIDTYIKDVVNDLVFNPLDILNDRTYEVSSFILSTYCRKEEFNPIETSSLIDFVDPYFSIDPCKQILIEARTLLNGEFEERQNTLDVLSSITETASRLKEAKCFAKIKFKLFDIGTGKYINDSLNDLTINDYEYASDFKLKDITYSYSGQTPYVYELRITKKGYYPVIIRLQSEFALSIDDVVEFDLGSINMIPYMRQPAFVLSWRRSSIRLRFTFIFI